jgi:hypothetical protein
MDSAAASLRGYQPQPARAGQAIEQAACLLSIKPTAQGILPDVQQRRLGLLFCPNPAQRTAGIGMLFSQPDLPKCSPAVRPEIISS